MTKPPDTHMSQWEATVLQRAMELWQKNKPDPSTLRDEDEEREPEEERAPMTVDQEAQDNGVGGLKRWM